MASVVARLAPYFTRSNPGRFPTDIPVLREAHSLGAEWHLLPTEHYNVFGFNLLDWASAERLTADIFGDAEERLAWAARELEKGKVSCAQEGWKAFASFSEFDYLFVCADEESPSFGMVRHIVNNLPEETACPTLEEVFQALLEAVQDRAAIARGEPPLHAESAQTLCFSMKRMRDAVISA
jgi:hypothetical protein